MELSLTDIGHRLKQMREDRGFIQGELAHRAGISQQTLSSAENGNTTLSTKSVVSLCRVLEISIDYLLLGVGSAENISELAARMEKLTKKQSIQLADLIEAYLNAFSPSDDDTLC